MKRVQVKLILRDYMEAKNTIGLAQYNEVFCTEKELKVLLKESKEVLISCIEALDASRASEMCPHCIVYRGCDNCPINGRTKGCGAHPITDIREGIFWRDVEIKLISKGIEDLIQNAKRRLKELEETK